MLIPYPQVLTDNTNLQTFFADYQEVVNENPLGDEFGIERGYGKWNMLVTWRAYGGSKGDKSGTDMAVALRNLFQRLGKSGNYTDIPLIEDVAKIWKKYDVSKGVPTLLSSSRGHDGRFTYTLNAHRTDIVVDCFMSVIYKNHPRLLQVWEKPAGNQIITFPSLPLVNGTSFNPAMSMRVKFPDKANFESDTLIVEQRKGEHPRLSRPFVEYNGKV